MHERLIQAPNKNLSARAVLALLLISFGNIASLQLEWVDRYCSVCH